MAEPWKSAPVVSSGAEPWKSAPMVAKPEAEESGGIVSSFVKGLKNFTPPLGAGSTTTKEASKAEVLAIREKLLNDPLNYIADQVPFVSQIKKIASDLKSGKDKGDVAAEAVGELIAGAASSPPILMGGATPTTARARYGGGMAETPKPSKPVNVGGLMDMAKTGKDILQVLKSPNPLTKLSALGRLFEKFASEVTPIEAPPTPTVVEAPPVASGTPVRPPLRGKQFGTFNDPTAPPLPAGVEPSGPVRPPLQGRQFGTTVAKMMREEVPGRQFGTSSQSRLVPAEAAAAAPAEMPALEQITEWLASRDGQTARRFTDPVVSEASITKQTLGDIMDRLMKNRKVPAEVPAPAVPAEVPPAAVETPQPATPAPVKTTAAAKVDLFPDPQQEGFLDTDNVEQIKKAIEEGKNLPPIVARENGQIIEGHHRAEAYKQLGKRPKHITVSDAEFERMRAEGMTRDEIEYEVQESWRDAARRSIEAQSQPATPAPSAAGKPVTAATLMEEVAKPAGKKVPPFDWTDEAQFQEYQKALVEDSNIYGNNRTTMADRVARFMKKNGIEPTDSGIVRALNESAEDIAVSPTTGLKRPSFNAADHEVLFDMIKDRLETPTGGATRK